MIIHWTEVKSIETNEERLKLIWFWRAEQTLHMGPLKTRASECGKGEQVHAIFCLIVQ